MRQKQNIGYIGSKYSLLEFIHEKITENIPDINDKVFCDLFAGTNIVSIYFKDKVKKIITNDIEHYSYVLASAYMTNENVNQDKIELLNDEKGIKSNIFNYYCENGESKRLYFNENNGLKIDAIRTKIEELTISKTEYYILLSSLIEASDKVANTTSVYGAYLKKLKNSAIKPLTLKEINIKIVEGQQNDVYNMDANQLVKNISGDILYIDPPYNHRQYGSNYHVLNMISKYDFSTKPKGVVGLIDYNKSDYSSKVKAKKSFLDLITNSNFKHIFISYNNEGIVSKDEMEEMLYNFGKIIIYEKKYKTYKADKNRNNKSKNTVEYLFYLKKIRF